MMIACLNKSTRVTNDQVSLMSRALTYQLRYHAAPAWEKVVPAVTFYQTDAQVPAGADKIIVFDNADQQGALGYHDVGPDDLPYSKVFAATTLDNGGQVLGGALSVSSVFSHECLEMFVDPFVHDWWDDGRGKLYAAEIGDPVESDSYPVPVDTKQIMVSNFILPAWHDPLAKGKSGFDYLGKLKAPFTMTKGGYLIVSRQGKVTQTFGDAYPEWKKQGKANPAARTARRATQTAA